MSAIRRRTEIKRGKKAVGATMNLKEDQSEAVVAFPPGIAPAAPGQDAAGQGAGVPGRM